jgi:hypothetical protein
VGKPNEKSDFSGWAETLFFRFLRQPLPALRQELQGYTDECAKDVKSLSEKEQQLLKQLNSTRSNLGDYIKSNGLQNFVRFQ